MARGWSRGQNGPSHGRSRSPRYGADGCHLAATCSGRTDSALGGKSRRHPGHHAILADRGETWRSYRGRQAKCLLRARSHRWVEALDRKASSELESWGEVGTSTRRVRPKHFRRDDEENLRWVVRPLSQPRWDLQAGVEGFHSLERCAIAESLTRLGSSASTGHAQGTRHSGRGQLHDTDSLGPNPNRSVRCRTRTSHFHAIFHRSHRSEPINFHVYWSLDYPNVRSTCQLPQDFARVLGTVLVSYPKRSMMAFQSCLAAHSGQVVIGHSIPACSCQLKYRVLSVTALTLRMSWAVSRSMAPS